MDSRSSQQPVARLSVFVGAAIAALCTGCDAVSGGTPTLPPPAAAESMSALDIVLTPHEGEQALDQRIRQLQQRISAGHARAPELERLGWTFIARARELNDPGAYNLALQAASAIDALDANNHGALLLRGHALQSLHRFGEAERVAQRLVDERGAPFDHGLLGDVLVDRGELTRAIESYQRMMDLRPDTHSYARAAHVRYLTGDLAGALEAMQLAARAASPRNRDSFAWTWAKLATYQLQSGMTDVALDSVRRALQVFPDSYHARKTEGLIALSEGEWQAALSPLRAAAASVPHPEVLWMLSEALEQLGRTQEASSTRGQLLAAGASEDPRSFALYLATCGQDLALAERLVRAEVAERKDIYTYEALAWVQSALGEHERALDSAFRSLAAGTEDPRLFYHAGLVADRAGDLAHAREWLTRAAGAASMLLPSQRSQLAERIATWQVKSQASAWSPHAVTSVSENTHAKGNP